MKTYDRNRNAIATGSMVMIAGNGTTGVIKDPWQGKTAEQLRRADCVEIDGCEGRFCPLDLIRLGSINPCRQGNRAGHPGWPSFPADKRLAKAPLNTHHKDRRHNNPAFDAEIIGKVILQTMIDIGRKTDAGDFGGAVGA
jgi:putative selenium-binding protein YdfZ